MAILLGHQRVVYQLAAAHETLAKKILVIPSSIAFCERGFSNATNSFTKVGHFGCFYVSIIIHDRVGEYGLEGSIQGMTQHEKPTSS